MAQITITLTGTSPLVCHNIQLADPDNKRVREIAALTGKRTKTEEDRLAIAKLEWFGGLYTDPAYDGPVIPSGNIRKCLIRAATITKQGTLLARSLFFNSLSAQLIYPGPHNPDELYTRPEYQYRVAVGVGQSRTMRTRPIFRDWSLSINGLLLEEMMDLDALVRIVEMAGVSEGLGDNRINGYGRFDGEVTVS